MSDDRSVVLGPGEGDHAGFVTFKARGHNTRAKYSLLESTYAPGYGGPAVHVHREEDEAFYIVSGELVMLLGDRMVEAPAGSFVLVPAGTIHGFANRTKAPATALVIISPGGFEPYFEEVRSAVSSGKSLEAAVAALAAKYKFEIIGPPLGAG